MNGSFNNWINQFRGLLILMICEEKRMKIMKMTHDRLVKKFVHSDWHLHCLARLAIEFVC